MTTAKIDLPQFDNESSAAYECRVRYLLLGPDRTVQKVADETGRSKRQLERWCAAHRWRDSARQYDELAAQLALQADMRQYAADLRTMQQDLRRLGEALTTVGLDLLIRVSRALDSMELTPGALTQAIAAITRGVELRGQALHLHALKKRYEEEEITSWDDETQRNRIMVDLDGGYD